MTRRTLLLSLAAPGPRLTANPFLLGIASGEPWHHSVALWTRLILPPALASQSIPVRWQIFEDEAAKRLKSEGTVLAQPQWAHSVHVEARGLQPGRWYWYRFLAGGIESPLGRTKTAPAGPADKLRFAFVSCQKYEDGFYTAYEHLAKEDLDLVVHLGDYIYENTPNKASVRSTGILESAVTLEQYRKRYEVYKSDPLLQNAHALFPWAVTPDDHEVSDDYASLIPDLDSPRNTFPARRAAAYQAYYEHMPLRPASRPSGTGIQLFRRLTFGNLADFHILDARQFRDDQPCDRKLSLSCPERLLPARTMLGAAQERWLHNNLHQSRSAWNVLAQQILMAELHVGDKFPMDKWDGYPAARTRFLDFLHQRRLTNAVVLTGDNHNNWVFDLKHDFARESSPILATEFAGTSVTSNRDGAETSAEYGAALNGANPHIRWHNSQRGYVRCELTPKLWRTDYRITPLVTRPGGPVVTKASFALEPGKPGAEKA
jgi:alkaline phosphatase D